MFMPGFSSGIGFGCVEVVGLGSPSATSSFAKETPKSRLKSQPADENLTEFASPSAFGTRRASPAARARDKHQRRHLPAEDARAFR